MSNRTQNCPFCDSARHGPSKCTSNIKKKYAELLNTMVSKECPDFHSYNMKELKIISYNIPFENNFSRDNRMSRECRKKKKIQQRINRESYSIDSIKKSYGEGTREAMECITIM